MKRRQCAGTPTKQAAGCGEVQQQQKQQQQQQQQQQHQPAATNLIHHAPCTLPLQLLRLPLHMMMVSPNCHTRRILPACDALVTLLRVLLLSFRFSRTRLKNAREMTRIVMIGAGGTGLSASRCQPF